MAFKPGPTALDTKASGGKIRLTERANSSTKMETSLMVNGRTIKYNYFIIFRPMVPVYITARMGPCTRGTGRMISRMVKVRSSGKSLI